MADTIPSTSIKSHDHEKIFQVHPRKTRLKLRRSNSHQPYSNDYIEGLHERGLRKTLQSQPPASATKPKNGHAISNSLNIQHKEFLSGSPPMYIQPPLIKSPSPQIQSYKKKIKRSFSSPSFPARLFPGTFLTTAGPLLDFHKLSIHQKKDKERDTTLLETEDKKSQNEYVYHTLFSHAAREVPPNWENFVKVLLKKYPSHFIEKEIKILASSYKCQKEIIYEFLWRWKTHFATVEERLNADDILANAAEEVGVKNWQNLQHHVKQDDLNNSVYLDNDYLKTLATNIEPQWKELGRALGFHEEELQTFQLDCDKTNETAILAMLILWKNREKGSTHLQVGKLIRALIECGRQDLAHIVGNPSDDTTKSFSGQVNKHLIQVDIEAQFAEFEKKWESIRVPPYIISIYLGTDTPLIFVDVEKGHLSDANKFLQSHFGEIMKTESIWVEEQEPFTDVMDRERTPVSHLYATVQTGSRLTVLDPNKLDTIIQNDNFKSINDLSLEDDKATYGTLSGFMYDDDNNVYGITSSHFTNRVNEKPYIGEWSDSNKPVISEQFGEEDSKLIHLGSKCSGMHGCDKEKNAIDIACVEIKRDTMKDISLKYKMQHGLRACLETYSGEHNKLMMKKVRKFGHRTMTTNGTIVCTNRQVRIGEHQSKGVFLVKKNPNQRQDCFANVGDSGSLVVSDVDGDQLVVYGFCFRICENYIFQKVPIGPVAICIRADHAINFLKDHFKINLHWCNSDEMTPQLEGACAIERGLQEKHEDEKLSVIDTYKEMEGEAIKMNNIC